MSKLLKIKKTGEGADKRAPEIVQKDDPVKGRALLKVAEPVRVSEIGEKKFKNILHKMEIALAGQADGVALAAPQINISSRIFIINPKVFEHIDLSTIKLKNTDELETVFINPEIIKISKDGKKMEEGCLSIRPWYGKVKRASRVSIKATNQNGLEFEMEGSGLLAQIFQHEIDHLNGILFIEKATNLKKLI